MSASPFSRFVIESSNLNGMVISGAVWVLKSEAEADKQAALAKAAEIVSPEVQALRSELNKQNDSRPLIASLSYDLKVLREKSVELASDRDYWRERAVKADATIAALRRKPAKKKPIKKKARK